MISGMRIIFTAVISVSLNGLRKPDISFPEDAVKVLT